MSDESPNVPVVERVARKRGRPPKVKAATARHDAAPTGEFEGWTHDLDVPEHPDFEFKWMTAEDLSRYSARGWVPEIYGPGCVLPRGYFGERVDGALVKVRELTLTKCPRAVAEKQRERDPMRARHIMLMKELHKETANGAAEPRLRANVPVSMHT